MTAPGSYARGLLITVLGVLIIAPDTLLIRLISADPWTLLAWRGGCSFLTVMAYVALFEPKELRLLPQMGLAGWGAVLSFAAGNTLFVYAVTHTLVANTLLLLATSPIWAALISRFVLGEVVGRRTWIMIAAVMIGVAVIAKGTGTEGGGAWDGDLAALGTALAQAISFSCARARKGRSTVPSMGLGALLSGLLGVAVAPTLALVPSDIAPTLATAIFVFPVAFIFLTIGPRHIPAADVGMIFLLEAVLGPLLVWWGIGERPGPWTIAGGAIILGAILLGNLAALRARNVANTA